MTKNAPAVSLEIPVVLEPVAGRSHFDLRGGSIAEVLEAAFGVVPALRHHLTGESGKLRPHILCIVNGVNIAREDMAKTTLADGDEILIHQAISGG